MVSGVDRWKYLEEKRPISRVGRDCALKTTPREQLSVLVDVEEKATTASFEHRKRFSLAAQCTLEIAETCRKDSWSQDECQE